MSFLTPTCSWIWCSQKGGMNAASKSDNGGGQVFSLEINHVQHLGCRIPPPAERVSWVTWALTSTRGDLFFTPWKCDLGLQANHDSAMILHNCGVHCLCTLGVMCTAFARGQFSVDVDREWTHFLTSHPCPRGLGEAEWSLLSWLQHITVIKDAGSGAS